MGEKREGQKLLAENGLTPELAFALRGVVTKVAGRRFRNAGKLAEAIAGNVWNPWNFGGAAYVRAVADNITSSSELFDVLGVAKVEVSNWRERLLRLSRTVLYIVEPMPSGTATGANTPTQEWTIVGIGGIRVAGAEMVVELEHVDMTEVVEN